MALGIGAPDLYARKLEEYEIALLPGAVLLLYTDGISEAMNDKHEESTDERLQDVFLGCAHLPPQQVIDQILTAVRGHAGARPMEDDLTLVVLKRLP
ncbi:MAG: SpoIIE family protein phosphatase [Planctomycetota bacterium]|nr:SpoIIE family protein phosphatase [Planctomycetota bacterium]